MDLVESLDKVNDLESFMSFVKELMKDRKNARKLESEMPEKFLYNSALDWQNQSIESYLDGAVSWQREE